MMQSLASLFAIKPGEGRTASLVIGVMLLTSAGFTLGSTAVEALFFTRFGTEYLPYMYLLLGVITLFTSLGITALLGRFRREKLYLFIPILVAVLAVLAWLALFNTRNVVYPVLWLGKEVVNSLITLVVWGVAGAVCDARQSKRLFPLFNAGRILGAVIGGLTTGLLVKYIGTQNLMLVWAILLLLTFALIRVLIRNRSAPVQSGRQKRRQKQPPLVQEMQRGYQFVRGSELMKWVSASAILFSVLYFSIALPFSKSIAVQYPDENALAGFLGLFNGISTAAAFLASLFLANRMYARFGIMTALLVLPVIYLIGFGSLVVIQTFAVIISFRFVQVFWLAGVADSAYQAIFNVVPPTRRDQVRAFIDGVPAQAGTFIAGIVLIIGEQAFSSQQLAVLGFITAAVTTYIIWRADKAYTFALVETLRNGRPTLFGEDTRPDSVMVHAALDGMKNPDPVVRRISTEIVSAQSPNSDILIESLHDEDTIVRIYALKGLASLKSSPAILDKIIPVLSAPEPEVRAQAVDTLRALSPDSHSLESILVPKLEDPEESVRVRVIVALLSLDPDHPSRAQLLQMATAGEMDERISALKALDEINDPQAVDLFTNQLNDHLAPLPIRCAAASALGSCGIIAVPILIKMLASEIVLLRTNAANALAEIGDGCLPDVVKYLSDLSREDGALIALDQLSAWKEAERVREYIQSKVESALRHESIRNAIDPAKDDRWKLLAESLHNRAIQDAINALRGLSLLGERESILVAVDNLKSRQQISNALETLETIRYAAMIRPLFQIWESGQPPEQDIDVEAELAQILKEDDHWLRACIRFVEEGKNYTMVTLSSMERVLLLRRVPLLADLSPADLLRVSAISTEENFDSAEIICEQGESGDKMYVIVTGEVRIVVTTDDQSVKEVARRKTGDVVGEMSLISGDARIASVIASSDVRTLCIDRLSFESLLRERPEVSLAVMRELCVRLKAMSVAS